MPAESKGTEEKGAEDAEASFSGGDYPESEIDAVRAERDVALQQYVSLSPYYYIYFFLISS